MLTLWIMAALAKVHEDSSDPCAERGSCTSEVVAESLPLANAATAPNAQDYKGRGLIKRRASLLPIYHHYQPLHLSYMVSSEIHALSLDSTRDGTITHVNLYQDTAHVTRSYTVNVPAGQTKLTISSLPNVMDHDSLRYVLMLTRVSLRSLR